MIIFREIDACDSILDGIALVRLLDYLAQKFKDFPDGLPLTKGGSFKRNLVAEAITAVQWPSWTETEIYNGYFPIKVADEQHFEPLWLLHTRLLNMRLARHFKGRLKPTKLGKSVLANRFERFNAVVQHTLFEDVHLIEMRQRSGLIGTWDIWLNVIDITATHGISGRDLTDTLYGVEPEPSEFDIRTSRLYDGVLQPLMYCGLIEENKSQGIKLVDRVYSHTRLWKRYLRLDERKPDLRIV